MIVTVTATVMDGTVVRWHTSLEAAQIHRPVLTASRRGVLLDPHTYLHEIPATVLQAATGAYERLRLDRTADVRALATHRHSMVINGPLVPVESEEADRG